MLKISEIPQDFRDNENYPEGGAMATTEMVRTAGKTVAGGFVLRASVLIVVGISGALFFGSFAFGELAGAILSKHYVFFSARFFWASKRKEQISTITL